METYVSKHFKLHGLAEGVYAAVAIEGGAALGNAGIIDLGDSTLVFDSLLTQQAATDLHAAAEHLTGRMVEYVANSHYHNDHIRGNQVFPSAQIVSTTKTRELIATLGLEEVKYDSENAEKELEGLKKQTDPGRKREVTIWTGYYHGVLESLPTLELKLPNLTFDTNIVFHGSKLTAEVTAFDNGHTPSDAILTIPGLRIGFLGDLLFVGMHPWLARGDPTELIRILDRIETFGLKAIVPGHGQLGTTEAFAILRHYVADLEKMAAQVVQEGGTEDEAAQKSMPSGYASWGFSDFFGPNMRFLYKRLSKTTST